MSFQPELAFDPGEDDRYDDPEGPLPDWVFAEPVQELEGRIEVAPGFAPVVEVVRSARRRTTVSAQLVGDTLRLSVPLAMPSIDVNQWIVEMTRRYARKHATDRVDLPRLAKQLAAELDLPAPTSISWAGDLRSRWGSCTPATGTIRLSSRLAPMPPWVLEYVVVHELCHLVVRGHTPAFWALVNRYPKAERARGYLMAKAGMTDDETDDRQPR